MSVWESAGSTESILKWHAGRRQPASTWHSAGGGRALMRIASTSQSCGTPARLQFADLVADLQRRGARVAVGKTPRPRVSLPDVFGLSMGDSLQFSGVHGAMKASQASESICCLDASIRNGKSCKAIRTITSPLVGLARQRAAGRRQQQSSSATEQMRQ